MPACVWLTKFCRARAASPSCLEKRFDNLFVAELTNELNKGLELLWPLLCETLELLLLLFDESREVSELRRLLLGETSGLLFDESREVSELRRLLFCELREVSELLRLLLCETLELLSSNVFSFTNPFS
ncbi:MAG TPA: hypothetical protein DEQ74_02230 [Wolbachia sp.]|nr:hypothetical protein [Wolbachia sp.]